jgi:hypothetical protein
MNQHLNLDTTFAPLSDGDLKAAIVDQQQEPSTPRPVMPVPQDAPRPCFDHRSYGSPNGVWPYKDANGDTLFYICRYEPPGGTKQVLPWTYWDDENGTGWRAKAPPSPRALFNLDQLAQLPGAPILIVEGEKAAVGLNGQGGAAALLPDHVVTTSMSGAKAAAKSDWSPLAGREVVVWPDADEPGAAYAQEVAELARAAGVTSVRIADVSGLPQGFDLADDLPPEINVALRIHEAAVPWPPLDVDQGADMDLVSFGPFSMTTAGLYSQKEGQQEKNWICAPFEVAGRVRNPEGVDWGRLLRWYDEDGRLHEHYVSDAALHGDQAALAGELARRGLVIATARGARADLASYLNQVRLDRRVTQVSRTGWHLVGGRRVFVLPDGSIGTAGDEKVLLQQGGSSAYECRGTAGAVEGSSRNSGCWARAPPLPLLCCLRGTAS